ncbi:904_t:CDS:2 [Acaulospora colombiana]|uniref:904_t:CDS:1 n=1 Tax=Acaulospora colombiana TaxID=27376 RepID=A0ACA9LU30_9GLOM|nr:904_t:CDS:2 [Acaulospora colombiana]
MCRRDGWLVRVGARANAESRRRDMVGDQPAAEQDLAISEFRLEKPERPYPNMRPAEGNAKKAWQIEVEVESVSLWSYLP